MQVTFLNSFYCLRIFILLLFQINLIFKGYTQSIPVFPFSYDADLRNLQLQGKFPSEFSLTVRPLTFSKKNPADTFYKSFYGISCYQNQFSTGNKKSKLAEIKFLPFVSLGKFSSHHPYGWNDGLLIPAKGLQTIFQGGIYGRLGPISVQLSPEIINANNAQYEKSADFGSVSTGVYKRFYSGQSSIRLNFNFLSFGVSSENIWWGPSQFSSLMMSNNAPGFKHLTFNSRYPLKTKIGNFEWQILSGRLDDEKNIGQAVEIFNLKSYRDVSTTGTVFFGDWKYLNAMIMSYQPSFLKNLTIGFSRQFSGMSKTVFDSSQNSSDFVAKYLPVVGKLFKSKLTRDESRGWNQLAEVFFKLQFPNAKSDMYFEYGWNDHSYNIRDFVMSPFHSASYTIGFSKVIGLASNRFISCNFEANHMEQSPDYLVRWAGSWYEHFQGTGYANMNQIIGAGAGFGSNLQVATFTYNKSFDKIGILFERIQKDPNPHVVRWNEVAIGILGRKKYGHTIFNGRLSPVFSRNYAWMQNADRINLMGMISVSYLW